MGNYAGFNQVQLKRPKKAYFDLSHQVRLTTRMGRLTPVTFLECIPGDVFDGSCEALVRVAPLLAPIYDQIRIYVHFYFVAYRLLWDEWETFITGGRLGAEAAPEDAPLPPYIEIGSAMSFAPALNLVGKSSLADYLGCPVFADINGTPSAYEDRFIDLMPFLVYQRCYMDYYRDRNFVPDDFMEFPVTSGLHPVTDPVIEFMTLRTRSYLHDYFTSALPFTQRGAEVLMPLAGSGTVTYLDQAQVLTAAGTKPAEGTLQSTDLGGLDFNTVTINDDPTTAQIRNIDEVLIDSSSVAINDLRSAIALQVWLERNAIAGSRYTESIQAHFGERPQDARLQRAEYIGGGLIPLQITEVVSTAYSDDGEAVVPLANLGGRGVSYGNTNRFHYRAPEHGAIIGIMSIMNPPSYHQGLPRYFRRRTFLDYVWPTFATLGEQQIDKAELYASPANLLANSAGQLPLFGYTSRYADWKYMCSRNAGDFHDTLLFWTLTRDFADSPTLSKEFNEFEDLSQNRIFAVGQTLDNFWIYLHNRVGVRRALPYFGKPNTFGFGS